MFGECHAHMLMNGYHYKTAVSCHKEHVREDLIRQYFQEYQNRNVLFVRDGGDALSVSFLASKIAPEYGIDYRTPVFAIHKNGYYGGIVGKGFDTLREYAALVQEVKNAGGNFIKIMVSGIVDFGEYGKITGQPLEKPMISEMVHIAHEEGFSVMVHANGRAAVLAAASAGSDSIEHGNYIDEECIQAMKEHGVIWVPTLVTIKNLLGSGRYEDAVVERILEQDVSHVRRAYEQGVLLALGSDAGAYRVNHGQGIVEEWNEFCEIFQDECRDDLEKKLLEGEKLVKIRF